MTDTAQLRGRAAAGHDVSRELRPAARRTARSACGSGQPVIEPVGESRRNADVFGELLRRLDLSEDGDPQGELEELLDVLARVPEPAGAELRADGVATPPHGGRPIQFVDVFPWTPDGKVRSVPGAPRRGIAGGTLCATSRIPATDAYPARPDFSVQRPHDHVDAVGAAASGSAPADASRRRGRAGHRGRSRRPHLQRSSARFGAAHRSAPGFGPAPCCCRRGSGASTPRTATPRPRSRPTR